jgi:hypothetical protein
LDKTSSDMSMMEPLTCQVLVGWQRPDRCHPRNVGKGRNGKSGPIAKRQRLVDRVAADGQRVASKGRRSQVLVEKRGALNDFGRTQQSATAHGNFEVIQAMARTDRHTPKRKGSVPRPRGRPKSGCFWDETLGMWVPVRVDSAKGLFSSVDSSILSEVIPQGQQQSKLAPARQSMGFTPDVASTLSDYGLECGSDAILTCSIEDPLPVVSTEQPSRGTWAGSPLLDNSDISSSELLIRPKNALVKKDNGTFKRPEGKDPYVGRIWNAELGGWELVEGYFDIKNIAGSNLGRSTSTDGLGSPTKDASTSDSSPSQQQQHKRSTGELQIRSARSRKRLLVCVSVLEGIGTNERVRNEQNSSSLRRSSRLKKHRQVSLSSGGETTEWLALFPSIKVTDDMNICHCAWL